MYYSFRLTSVKAPIERISAKRRDIPPTNAAKGRLLGEELVSVPESSPRRWGVSDVLEID